MSSALALLVCSGFVFYLLRYDSRQRNTVSAALWIPTIWMLSIATKSVATWFGFNEDIESGSLLDQIFVSSLLCLGLLILARRKLDWSSVVKRNSWLTLLIIYMLISVIWSEIPFISFKRWTREVTAVIMALVVLTESAPRQAMESLFRRTVYILIPFSILLIKYFPQYGIEYGWSGEVAWTGVTLQKNGLGRLCLISAFFLIWSLFRRWKGREVGVPKMQTLVEVVLLLLTLWLLKGPSSWAASASGFVALSSGLATFAALLWMKKHRINLGANGWMIIAGCIIGLGIIQPLVGGSTVGGFASSLGRNATLTGRTDIWAKLISSVMQRPILGAGFGGFWTSITTAKVLVNEAHNGYLGVWLGLGVVGLILTGFFLLVFCRNVARALDYDFDWSSLCLCYLVMAMVHNISECSFDSFTRHLMAVILFLAVTLPAALKRRSAHAQSVKRKPVNWVTDLGRSVKTDRCLVFFAPIALLWPVVGADGATITAASTSFSDVSAAVAQANTGDTVILPAGSSDWTTQSLTVTKAITIQGQGDSLNGTVITNLSLNGGGTFQLLFNDTVNLMRITGIYFNMGAWDENNRKTGVRGDATVSKLRIDHCHFEGADEVVNMQTGPCFGVVDHCTFHNCTNEIYNQNINSADIINPGELSWRSSNPIHPGGIDTLVVEDCVFLFDVNTNHNGSILYGQQGDRLCVRHCTFDYSASPCPISVGDPHGFGPVTNPGGWGCSTRFWEIYDNTLKAQYTYRWWSIRGGTYIIHDNTYSGANVPNQPYQLFNEDGTWPPGQTSTTQLVVGYFYNDTVNSVPITNAAYAVGINPPIENKHFFNRAPQSGDSLYDGTSNSPYHFYGYVPLVYPHPLVSGQDGSAPSPPTNLHVAP